MLLGEERDGPPAGMGSRPRASGCVQAMTGAAATIVGSRSDRIPRGFKGWQQQCEFVDERDAYKSFHKEWTIRCMDCK
jgi:hypothetical protein